MKKNLIIIFFLCICVLNSHAQGNLVNQQIQQARISGERFEVVSIFTPMSGGSASQNNRIQEQTINPEEVYVLQFDPTVTKKFSSSMTLQIPLGCRTMQLELQEVEMDYIVETSCGQRLPANRNIRHYQGVVKGNTNSLVAITFGENEIMGLVATDEGNFNIAFDRELGAHIFFNDRNVRQQPEFTCGTSTDESFEGYCPDVLLGTKNTKSSTTSCTKVVKLYYETTYDIFQALGSVGAVETFVFGLHNQVSLLYRNEGIYTRGFLSIWNSNDSWSTHSVPLNIASYLYHFQNIRTSFAGDLGQLLTFRGPGVGGAAPGSLNGLCNPSVRERLSVAMIENITLPNFPVYSRVVKVMTHEFGHLMGSHETHACFWNGNNTAIDGCGTVVPNPITGLGCPQLPIPTQTGTIMSYCDHPGRPGVDFINGFGEQPGNLIRHRVSQANCLSTYIEGPTIICGTGVYSIYNSNEVAFWSVTPGFTIISPVFSWHATNSATVAADGHHGQEGTLTAWIPGLADPVVTRTIHAHDIPSLSISGSNILSDNQSLYQIPNLPPKIQVTWTLGSGISGGTTTSNGIYLSPIVNACVNSWVEATIHFGGCPQTLHKLVVVRNPALNITGTITSDKTETNICGNINVQDVTVTGNNAKLKLVTPGEVTINGPFEVTLGAQLEVK